MPNHKYKVATNYKKLSYLELFALYLKINVNNKKENNRFLDRCTTIQRGYLYRLYNACYYIGNSISLDAKDNRAAKLSHKIHFLIDYFFNNPCIKIYDDHALIAIKYNLFEAYSAFLEQNAITSLKKHNMLVQSNKRRSIKIDKSKIQCEKIYKLRSFI